MKRWCETDKPHPNPDPDVFPNNQRIVCRWQEMKLQTVTVKGVPEIPAYVCPNCGEARWLPESSITPFIRGLQK